MSDVEENKPTEQIMFVKLKNNDIDLIGYVSQNRKNKIQIRNPVRIYIETILEEGRQIVCMQEYLPQQIIDAKTVSISVREVEFMHKVKDDFIEQYENISQFFFGNKEELKKKLMKKLEENSSNTVVSILDAIASKSKKPN